LIKARIKKNLLSASGRMSLEAEFEIADKDFVSFFGASGTGKTTILRIISGLVTPDEGRIEVDGRVWFDSESGINLVPQERRVGFVFQDYSLFPHMNARRNVEFALDRRRDDDFVDKLLDMVQMRGLQYQKPMELSGGQRQRVALARALARRPKLLLLDEPFSSLDPEMRLALQDEVSAIYRQFGITTIFVSHDVSEVFKLSRRVFVLKEGKIVNSGAPDKIFVENNLSGKFKFSGTIIDIKNDSFMNILSVQVGNSIVRVLATDTEMEGLGLGSKVIIASKAFNPVVMKYSIGGLD